MKQCFKCHQTKSLDDFYRHKAMSDGHVNKCKECNKLDVKSNRADKVDYYRAYDAKRFKGNPKVKARNKRYAQSAAGKTGAYNHILKQRAKFPEKYKARNAVNNAIRDGKLIKPTSCEVCLLEFPSRLIHGHHEDYSKPLDVMWVCPPCHKSRHDELDSINGECNE